MPKIKQIPNIQKIQINVPEVQDLCQVKPLAFINMLLHAHRFWKKDGSENKYAYGLLLGTFEEKTRIIHEAIPILPSEKPDLALDEQFFKHWDDLEKLQQELGSINQCVGWYKVVDGNLRLKAKDVRNQAKVQSLGGRNVVLLLDPNEFVENHDYGFSIYQLIKSGGLYHEMCEDKRIPWEVMELGNDVDKGINLLLELVNKYKGSKPFVEEIDEFEMPEIIDDGKDGDDAGYIEVEIDPNAPIFY